MIDPKTLEEIEAALAGATPGPWDVQCLRDAVRHLNRNVDHESYCLRSHDDKEPHGEMPGRYDGALIALLRNNAESLIAAAKKLAEVKAALRHLLPNSTCSCLYSTTLPRPCDRCRMAVDEAEEALSTDKAGS
jgi:hypothetical protein